MNAVSSVVLRKQMNCEKATHTIWGKKWFVLVGWFVGLEARQLLRLFAPIYNWGEIYSCSVCIKNNKKITKGKAV
jgi:hypothetical protein